MQKSLYNGSLSLLGAEVLEEASQLSSWPETNLIEALLSLFMSNVFIEQKYGLFSGPLSSRAIVELYSHKFERVYLLKLEPPKLWL